MTGAVADDEDFVAPATPNVLRKVMIDIVLVAFGLYAVLVVIVYAMQDGLLYFPTKDIERTPVDIGLPYEEIALATPDGETLTAWYVPAPNGKIVLLFCHGNAGNISHRLESIRIFNRLGLSVLMFDYRGYGTSTGKPSEAGTYQDAETAWNYLIATRGVGPGNIVIFGRSLGAAVAAELAVRKAPAAVILESAFTSVPEIGAKLYPLLPARLLSRHRYNTMEKVSHISSPKLFIHSPNDEIIPFEQGCRLYAEASSPKEMLALRGGHNDGFMLSGTTYTEGIRSFIDRHCPP